MDYRFGDCNFCRQNGVKVKPLHCQAHFYCRMCEEFAPRFQKKDFYCRLCSDRSRKLDAENIDRVEQFIAAKTGGSVNQKGFKDVTVSLDGAQIVQFCQNQGSDDEDDDDDDLNGNNEEWEKLLDSLTKEGCPSKKYDKQTGLSSYLRDRNFQNSVRPDQGMPLKEIPQPMNRAKSFIKLVLPSADDNYEFQSEAASFSALRPTISTQHSRYFLKENFSPKCSKESLISNVDVDSKPNFPNWRKESHEEKQGSGLPSWLSWQSNVELEEEPMVPKKTFPAFVDVNDCSMQKEERNTSPCKENRIRRQCPTFLANESDEEIFELYDATQEIEGPNVDSIIESESDKCKSGTLKIVEDDDFWNF